MKESVISESCVLATVMSVRPPMNGIDMRKTVSLLVASAILAGSAHAGTRSARATGLPGPASFVSGIDNPWFPLQPGTIYVYRGVSDGQPARDVLTVTHRTKTIEGVRCTVIDDRVYLGGRLRERTTDWYAQDKTGNVWYLGERTATLDASGRTKSTDGTWQAGIDGARAGIYMPAAPRVGHSGQQEFYRGHAEDHFTILSLSTSVRTPAAASSHALLTGETTPLEPGIVDHKIYIRGIGTVREETIRGGKEQFLLVSIRHR
jgi:hypothetical protein